MIQTMKDIIRRFCAYGMEYKEHEWYIDEWVKLLPAIKLVYSTIQHSTTGKSPSLVEKGWKPSFPVDHLKKSLLTIHDMWKRACDTAEAKQYKKKRYNKTHKEPDFREGHKVPVSTLNFDNLKGPKKMRD
ncbi:hypothetical protein O181_025264 [Austropuccinia psidii MF-1]|uniref:Integrase catalytic domain-containing protein n=1 Tax=Austropuccinia psidii MF-1 TaxID=1389203 RepID=A0A9Q3CHQ5_9BASI|nr:hypothetical protein [Austropuccinia psidii MF-1]